MLNLILFIMNCVFITMRFRMKPGSFTRSFTDQVESLFIPAFVSSDRPYRVYFSLRLTPG